MVHPVAVPPVVAGSQFTVIWPCPGPGAAWPVGASGQAAWVHPPPMSTRRTLPGGRAASPEKPATALPDESWSGLAAGLT